MRAYLSGAIEHAADGGRPWRREVARLLEGELLHEVFDPSADEKQCLTAEEVADFRRWKTEDPQRFRQVVRKIIAWDLDQVEQADYVIALWDRAAARGGGTAAEVTLAHRLGKPVYLLLGMPVEDASGWVLSAATEVFDDLEALRVRLREIFGR